MSAFSFFLNYQLPHVPQSAGESTHVRMRRRTRVLYRYAHLGDLAGMRHDAYAAVEGKRDLNHSMTCCSDAQVVCALKS